MKVSCVCCTYGRFTVLERSIACWIRQDYDNKELIIFNTAKVPLSLSSSLQKENITVVNSTKLYLSLGEVREDALKHINGDVYICWDDDDLFLPWHIKDGVERMKLLNKEAWMPKFSYFSQNGGRTYVKAQNAMEASVLVNVKKVLQYGFSHESGAEHLPWRNGIVQDGTLIVEDVEPSYAYVWGDALAPHKTSGNINNPSNFRNHMDKSVNFGDCPLEAWGWGSLRLYFQNILECFPEAKKLKKVLDFYRDMV